MAALLTHAWWVRPRTNMRATPAIAPCRVALAKLLDRNRDHFDAFLIAHGTDTMPFTAAALSLMLTGFKKPIVLTGTHPCVCGVGVAAFLCACEGGLELRIGLRR
jgi:hypothetical protein